METQRFEKLKKLNDRLVKQQKTINTAPTDQLVYIRDKLSYYIKEISKILDKCLVVKNSDNQIIKLRKNLKVAENQLKRLSKQKLQSQPKQPQGWFIKMLLFIPRTVWWLIKNILFSIAFIVSVGYKNYFKQEEKRQYDIQAEIQKWTGNKLNIQYNIRMLPTSKQLHIRQIIEFIQTKGPQISSFVGDLQKTFM